MMTDEQEEDITGVLEEAEEEETETAE